MVLNSTLRIPVAYPGILFGGGCSTNSVEDRGQREWVLGSGGSCNLVQEMSFHIVKFLNFWYFKTIYDDNQFICHC